MRIGVVSDTHNHLANVARIVDLFNESEVERVVHTGDITQAKTLEVLAQLNAPLVGVYGNNDEREALGEAAQRFGIELHDAPLHLEWSGRHIIVVHDPRDLETPNEPTWDLALHGHTHLHAETRQDGRLVFNPGESAGHLKGRNAIGVVDLTDLSADILLF